MGTIKCPRCGANNDEESAFCAKCGYRIQAEKFVFQGQYSMGSFKKKSSKLGIVAAIFSVFGCMCYVGLILAIIDLCIRTPNKRYRWSYFAIIACIVWTIIFGALGAYGEDYVPPEKDTTQIETQLYYLIDKKVNLLEYIEFKIFQVTSNSPNSTFEMFK